MTEDTDLSGWINLPDGIDEPIIILHTSSLPTTRFTLLQWDKLRCTQDNNAEASDGTIGYRILHRRQHGGRGVTNLWEFRAYLIYINSAGQKTRYWLCRAYHYLMSPQRQSPHSLRLQSHLRPSP